MNILCRVICQPQDNLLNPQQESQNFTKTAPTHFSLPVLLKGHLQAPGIHRTAGVSGYRLRI
jgi:hypothetical protein